MNINNTNKLNNNNNNNNNFIHNKLHKLKTYLSTKKHNVENKHFKRYGCDLHASDDEYLNSPIYKLGDNEERVNEFNENIKFNYNRHHSLVKAVEEDIKIFDSYENYTLLQQ